MQLVSWNCRGMGNPLKADAVIDLLRMVPLDILLLQETKVDEEVLLLLSKNKWKLNSGKAVSARGTCGGLATLWCEEKFHLKFFLPPSTGYSQSSFMLPVRFQYPFSISKCQSIILKNKLAGTRYNNF